VTYHIRTTHPLSDAVAPWVVRPADGYRLCPVHAVRAGDEIVAFDGTVHTVTNTWRSRDGWWVLSYTTGEVACIPPSAVLRLTEPTPHVTSTASRSDLRTGRRAAPSPGARTAPGAGPGPRADSHGPLPAGKREDFPCAAAIPGPSTPPNPDTPAPGRGSSPTPTPCWNGCDCSASPWPARTDTAHR